MQNDMRDRLIELLKMPFYPKVGADPAEIVADHLLANGVILPEKEDVSPRLNCVEGWAAASANGVKSYHDNCWKLQKGMSSNDTLQHMP
jgi:hypothetical protein